MKPADAIKAALTQLQGEDFILDDVVDLAEQLLGEDEELCRREFTRSALKQQVRQRLRTWQEEPDPDDPAQLELLGPLPKRRLPVRQDDGTYKYRSFKRMVWSDLLVVRSERSDGIFRDQAELDALETLMRKLAPMMALNPVMTVEEAVRGAGGGAAGSALAAE